MTYNQPDLKGKFGEFGGRYVAETLIPAVLEIEEAYAKAKNDPSFQEELKYYLTNYVGRPSPLYFAKKLTETIGGAKIRRLFRSAAGWEDGRGGTYG